MAKSFVEQFDISYPVYADPKRLTYQHMGFKRAFGLGFSSIGHATRASRGGYRQGPVQGDPWQQGGEALFSQSGELLWSHSSKMAGAHAEPEDILKVIQSLQQRWA